MTRKSSNYRTLRVNLNHMNLNPINFPPYTRNLHQVAFNALNSAMYPLDHPLRVKIRDIGTANN